MKVIISPLAEWKIERLLDYLEFKWSKKTRDKYLKTLLKNFSQISEQPNSAPHSEEFPNLHKRVVTAQSSFFYRIVEGRIEVIDLIDNRQNPDKIQLEIKEFFG